MLKRWIIYALSSILLLTSFCLAEDTLNLSIRDADIRDVLQGIAIQNGINIVPDSTVTGNITINLRNTTLEEGLKILLKSNGLEYEKQGDLYLVRKKVTTPKNFVKFMAALYYPSKFKLRLKGILVVEMIICQKIFQKMYIHVTF